MAKAELFCSKVSQWSPNLPKAQFVLLIDKCSATRRGNTWQVDNRWEDFVVPMV